MSGGNAPGPDAASVPAAGPGDESGTARRPDPDACTLVIGLDGADVRYLDRFSGALPTISALRSRGVAAPLASTHPPTTASAWPSVYAGVGPADHGVHGFFTYEDDDPAAARLVDRTDVRAPAIWDYLASVGVKSVVVNVPVTHPAGGVAGAVVPGYFAPPDADPSPPDVLEATGHEDYRIYPEGDRAGDAVAGGSDGDGGEGTTPSVESLVAAVEDRAALATALLERVDWQFAMVVIQATDTVAHDHGTDRALRRVYAAADDAVERLLAAVPDGTGVLLCSDHGMERADGYRIRVNERLRDRDLLAGSGDPPRRGGAEAVGIGRLVAAACARTIRSALDAAGIEGNRVPGAIRWVGDAALDPPVAVEGVDWERSRAFCRVGSEYGVRISLAGREPGGVVPEDEYEAVRSTVIEALSTLRTPGGDPAFEVVERYETLVGEAPTGDAPDVCCLPAAGNDLSGLLTGRRLEPADGMAHRSTGVFVAADGAFAGVEAPADPSVVDLAPIALASLGLPVPERVEGSVPTSFPGGRRARYEGVEPPGGSKRRREADDPGATTVRDRLDDLGYL